jgi:hypothetical protein
MGDEIPFQNNLNLMARFPVECRIRLVRNGKVIRETSDDTFGFALTEPGVYRIEAWLMLDDEERPWIYSNPIYVR